MACRRIARGLRSQGVRIRLGIVLSVVVTSRVVGETPDFALDVQPILQRSCVGCHGEEKQKSSYRVDVRDTALRGGASGKTAILPHNAAESPLIRFVSGEDSEMMMPPRDSGLPPLTAEEVSVLRRWIDAGPAWPDALAGKVAETGPHWSLLPLIQPVPPGNAANPIDAFVHSRLTEKGLTASPEADHRTLLRRVYHDLIGLSPTPDEVAAFLADTDARAFETVVERLLASPRHGERWARHWLDTIHFADSHGYEHDIGRENAWRYRDYVISALNNDTPWAQFIHEQLAADVFYPEATHLTPALGFLGAGTFDLSTYSTGPITFEYLDRDDLVTQTMSAFVSTTANCARCHAHKFDPISQEDYYALQANFAGILKGDLKFDAAPEVAKERKRLEALLGASTNPTAALLSDENEALTRDWLAARGAGAKWTPLTVETYISNEGATLARSPEGAILSSGKLPDKDQYVITGHTEIPGVTALRLDVYTQDTLPMQGPGRRENGNVHLSELEVQVFEAGAATPRAVVLRRATADFNQADWGIEKALDGDPKTAWGIHPAVGQAHHAVFELDEPLTLSAGARLAVTLRQDHGEGHVIGAFGLSVTADAVERAVALPAEVETALALPEAARSEAQRIAIAQAALAHTAEAGLARLPEQARVYAAAKAVELIDAAARPLKEIAAPSPVHLLARGDFDKPRDEVAPGALSALAHLPARFAATADEGARRAALAEWLAHPDNVLTWRSVVNRVWHYHFGRGLCDTPSDFGRMGGTPSHPELIDWLAVWFRDEAKGSLKALHRLIVTSATYRQSSDLRETALAIDADNRLLWRQNRMRLDADAYRDFTLAVAGTLDLTMGGPGVQNFSQSKGPQLTPALDYKAFDWNGPGAGRRSVYRFVWRGIADPFMEALDFPDLGLLAPVRGFSVSSLQALALFNNDFVLTHSEALARRCAADAATLEAQVARGVDLTWLRKPTEEELAAFTAFAHEHGLAAFCRVLLNSNEYLFVD